MERRYLQLAVIPNPELKEPASTFQQLHAIASAEDRDVSVQGTNETAAASAGGAGVVAVSIVRDVTVLEISRLFYRPAPCHCQARSARLRDRCCRDAAVLLPQRSDAHIVQSENRRGFADYLFISRVLQSL